MDDFSPECLQSAAIGPLQQSAPVEDVDPKGPKKRTSESSNSSSVKTQKVEVNPQADHRKGLVENNCKGFHGILIEFVHWSEKIQKSLKLRGYV